MRIIALVVVLVAAAIATSVFLWRMAGTATPSIHGWTAMALGVGFSLVIGIGLMVMVFASSRRGHDEPPRWQ